MQQLKWIENYVVNRRQFGEYASWCVRLFFVYEIGQSETFLKRLKKAAKWVSSASVSMSGVGFRHRIIDLLNEIATSLAGCRDTQARDEFKSFFRQMELLLGPHWFSLDANELWKNYNACKDKKIFAAWQLHPMFAVIGIVCGLRNLGASRELLSYCEGQADGSLAFLHLHPEHGIEFNERIERICGHIAIKETHAEMVAYCDSLIGCYTLLSVILKRMRFRYRPRRYVLHAIGPADNPPIVLKNSNTSRMHMCSSCVTVMHSCGKSPISGDPLTCLEGEQISHVSFSQQAQGPQIRYEGLVPGLHIAGTAKLIWATLGLIVLFGSIMFIIRKAGFSDNATLYWLCLAGVTMSLLGVPVVRATIRSGADLGRYLGWIPSRELELPRILERQQQ